MQGPGNFLRKTSLSVAGLDWVNMLSLSQVIMKMLTILVVIGTGGVEVEERAVVLLQEMVLGKIDPTPVQILLIRMVG